MAKAKEVYIKTYQSGSPRVYKGFSVDYEFQSITSQLNSGYGSLDFTLPREFDVLKSEDPQSLSGYELDVVAYDEQQNEGVVLFNGEVSISKRVMSGQGESVSYTATSPLERIAKIDLEDTDSVVTYTATEIGAIMKDIIDKCNTKAGTTILTYTATSIANTGKNITTTLKNAFVGKALKDVWQATDSGWVWFIDVDKTVYLKQVSSTPDHYFFNSKDITSIERETDKTKVVNVLKFWDGLTTPTVLRRYTNASSIASYGYSAQAQQDGRFTTTAGADEYGERFITDNKEPNDQIKLTIIDSSGGGYDIDTIKVGDTFKVLNLKEETNFPSLLVVTSKTDYLDYCEIVASDRETYVSRELANLKAEQFQVNNSDHPATAYTTVPV